MIKLQKSYIYLLLFFTLILYADNLSEKNLNKTIEIYQINDGDSYKGGDALTKTIRDILDIDIYSGENSIYFEWDEKNYNIDYINIYKNGCKTPVKTISSKAIDINHKWQGYMANNLKKNCTYTFSIELILKNQKILKQNFVAVTKDGIKTTKKREFKIYDQLNGCCGLKAEYLKTKTIDGTMQKFGLINSAMFWVDDFFSPIPSSHYGDINRIFTKPQPKILQKLVYDRKNSTTPYKTISDNDLIILDIEHLPTIVSYVEKEFAPHDSYFYTKSEKTKNGRMIVSHAIAKKLICIKAIKDILPNSKVGLWGSIVPWNRYNVNKNNLDYNALAKGVNRDWLVNYKQWHEQDSILYQALADSVDYLSPPLYPVFDLSNLEGRKKMLGFIMSKLMEIKRLNPDAIVIPTISPQYTESWADNAGYNKKPIPKGEFSWYLNTMYKLYEDGYIDSIIIWGDNEKTTFLDYTKQDWWFELLDFTKKYR